MIINSVIHSTTSIHRSSSAAPVREANTADDNRNVSQVSASSATSQEQQRERFTYRRVDEVEPAVEPSRQRSRLPYDDNDLRQAELITFNQRSFNASQTFLQIQYQDDTRGLVDTYA